MQVTTVPLRCCLLPCATAISSDGRTILCRSDEIRVTDPSYQANGILLARIDTRIKLHISFHPSSSIQFLKLPKTPSMHSDCDGPEQSLKCSLEPRGSTEGAAIQNVCSKCKERKDQATRDFRAQSTIITIKDGQRASNFSSSATLSITHAFQSAARFRLWLVPHISGYHRCHSSGSS